VGGLRNIGGGEPLSVGVVQASDSHAEQGESVRRGTLPLKPEASERAVPYRIEGGRVDCKKGTTLSWARYF